MTPKLTKCLPVIRTSGIVLLFPLRALFFFLIEFTPYSKYIGGRYDRFAPMSLLGILVQLSLFVLVTYTYQDDAKYKMYYSLQTISLCLTIFGVFHVLVGRLQYPFSIHSILMIPLALETMQNAYERLIVKTIVVICFAIYCLVIVFILGSNEVYPYQCILTYKEIY